MRNDRQGGRLFFTLLPLLLLRPSLSYATLGESVESIEADRALISGVRQDAETKAKYTIHTIVSDSVTIRQYVNNSTGKIFGIGWNGFRHPDITKLLGSSATEYASQTSPRRPGSRSRSFKSAELVVEHWGRMTRLGGHAFNPKLLPAGVTANDIK